jgi:GT2 family glycosyltransferase
MNNPKVAIIVINWNNATDTLSCLESLSKLEYSNFDVVVIDNGSTDNSVEFLQNRFPNLKILETGANLGYSGGNNAGITWALTEGFDWVFLLNNDTILAPNSLSIMIEVAKKNSSIGILGPTVFHGDTPTIIQSYGGILDRYWRPHHLDQNELVKGQLSQPSPVHWVSGCALLARSMMIRHIGLLDNRFYLYEEELDWCVRARHAQWSIIHVPDAHVWHWGVNNDYQPTPYVTYYMVRNHFLLLAKHKPGKLPWVVASINILRTMLSWSIRPKWRSKVKHRNAMWQGILDFLFHRWGKMPE